MKKNLLAFWLILCATSEITGQQPRLNIGKQFYLVQLHYQNALRANNDSTRIPKSTLPGGALRTIAIDDWCSGFFAGSLWYLYEYTRKAKWKTQAAKWTHALESIQYFTGHHDIGFMMGSSYGNAYRITAAAAYKPILIQSAKSLAKRFHPRIGLIKSWDHAQWQFPVIIDNMMNLELLFEATRLSGDSQFYKIAVSHADHDMVHHFRSNASSYHLVDYDTLTGNPIKKQTVQGAHDSSSWSRGQSWALYGFTTMYRYTKNRKYLEHAEKIVQYLISHPNMPADKIPYWDYHAPAIPAEERDASAAAIMASAMLELSMYLPGKKSVMYLHYAEDILHSLSSPAYFARPGSNNNFLLMHGVGAKPFGPGYEVDSPLNYADYYYLEALTRLDKIYHKRKLFH